MTGESRSGEPGSSAICDVISGASAATLLRCTIFFYQRLEVKERSYVRCTRAGRKDGRERRIRRLRARVAGAPLSRSDRKKRRKRSTYARLADEIRATSWTAPGHPPRF